MSQQESGVPQQEQHSESVAATETVQIKHESPVEPIKSQDQANVAVNNGPSSSGSLEIKVSQGNQNESQRPKKQMLSPKSLSGSRRAQSPGVYKGKLETVKKLLAKQEEKYNVINLELTSVRAAHETLLKEWQAKQSSVNEQIVGNQNSEEITKQIEGLHHNIQVVNEQIGKLTAQRDHKLQNLIKEKEELTLQIQKGKNQLQNSQRLFLQNKGKQQAKLKQIKESINHTEEQVSKLINQQKNNLNKIADVKSRKTAIEANKQKLSAEVRLNNQKAGNEKQQAEQRKQQLQKRIADAKERINQRKKQLNDLQGKESNKPNDKSKIEQEIKQVKAQNHQLALSVKKAEEANVKRTKDASENREAEKKKEKKLAQLISKIDEANKRKSQLKEQIVKFDSLLQDKKAAKYEQKIPEQLVALKAKNDQIRRDIKKILQKNEVQKSELGQLVPPTVIQNMNKKISNTIANNEKLSEIAKFIEEVTIQTEKLAEERESLQWGDNNFIKELEKERKKQEEKNKILEDEVAQKKRSIQQQQAKLKEYTLAYPQFKPEKKKKVEPEKAKKEQKGKKGGSAIVQQQKPIEIKKKKSANQIVTKSEIVNPVVEEPKKQKAGKKKKKTQESEQKSPSPQASPPAKVQVKSQPKVQQKAPAKVEVKQEVKVEPKPQPKVQVKQETKAQIKVEPKQQVKKQQKQVKVQGQPKKKNKKK